jgi:hypothetical protein
VKSGDPYPDSLGDRFPPLLWMTSARVFSAWHPDGMVLRLDPGLPLLWRSPSSVQFGSDEPSAVLSDVTEGEDRLLAALATGVSESGFAMLADSLGVSAERSQALLGAVAPVLARERRSPSRVAAVLGDGALARAIAGLLSASGSLGAVEDAALVVLVADWVVSPADHLRWLNRDVAHLPVVTTERGVTVGPLAEPGVGPCLYCVHLARVDADPAWTAIATQLLGRAGHDLGALAVAEASAFVARRVLERLSGGGAVGVSWRLDGEGEVSARPWARHPDCRCAAPEGTDWAAAPDRADRDAPTTASAVGALV